MVDRVLVEIPPQDAVLIMNSDGKHEHADCCRQLRRQDTIQSDVRSPCVRTSFLPVFLATCSQRVPGSHLLYCGGDLNMLAIGGQWRSSQLAFILKPVAQDLCLSGAV